MTTLFEYKAKTDTHEDALGTIEAQNFDEAIKALQNQGLFIISIKEISHRPREVQSSCCLRIPVYIKIKTQFGQWCQGRNGFIRVPLLLFFAYIFLRHLQDPNYSSIFGWLNLGIHELGHFLFAYAGEFLAVAGGTIFQLFVPLFGIYNFIKQNDYFAAVLCLGWLSTNFFNVAQYAGDARAMVLPLVTSFGAEPTISHDWNYLLSRMGLLAFDDTVALVFRLCAILSMAICLFVGGWMVSLMSQNGFLIKEQEKK